MFTKSSKHKLTWGQADADRRLPEGRFLMRINKLIDFSPIEKALKELYPDGMDRPSCSRPKEGKEKEGYLQAGGEALMLIGG